MADVRSRESSILASHQLVLHEHNGRAEVLACAGSVQLEGLSCGFDDLPQPAVCPDVPDATITVRPELVKHAETDKLAKPLSGVAWRYDFTR